MNRLTKEQATILSAYTGVLLMDDFGEVHEYIEKILGEPILTHMLANKEIWEKIKEKAKPDLEKLIYKNKTINKE